MLNLIKKNRYYNIISVYFSLFLAKFYIFILKIFDLFCLKWSFLQPKKGALELGFPPKNFVFNHYVYKLTI